MRSLLSFLLFIALLTGSTMAKSETQVYGYVEKATLVDKSFTLSAKLDTGAKSASLNASNIQEIEVKGVPYLRFTVSTKTGEETFECEYIGKVKIKVRAGETNGSHAPSTPIKRPVVLINVKLGDKVRAIHVNLTNRKRFLYPLLLGRDAIIDFNGAVNPALTFTLNSKSLA
ncbi:MAG: RimK/LysX family protein [Legionella sp.]